MRAACAMDDNRKTVALLCLKYQGGSLPLEGPFLGLDATKYRKICIYLKTDANLPTPVEEKGCHSYYMSRLRAFRIFNFFVVWKLAKVLRSERVDILHCQRHQATVYGAIAARLAKTRVVLAHVHGLNRSRRLRRRLINVLVLRWVN
ncbi:MAG: glycosyltransferase, partial [Planctomycetes bacterium]|nr:glycosyltransferase [Planctomycetota bacterium]